MKEIRWGLMPCAVDGCSEIADIVFLQTESPFRVVYLCNKHADISGWKENISVVSARIIKE